MWTVMGLEDWESDDEVEEGVLGLRRVSRSGARRTVTARVLSVLGATMRSRGALACLASRGTWRSLGCTCCEELNVCNNKLEYLYILYIILKAPFPFLVLMLAFLLFFYRF